jgi:1-phosphofructokinase family hexose kinase
VPGGKGFNVARAAIRLGGSAVAYGFLGGHVGEALREMIAADGIVDRHTTVEAGTRVCFIVVEPGSGRTTVLNEPGPVVTTDETDRLLADLRADCGADDLVILSGSLPDSVDPAVAGAIVEIGNAAGARTLVDIHSAALRFAADRQPWMLKCNRRELLELLRAPDADALATPRELALAMQELRRARSIDVVVVTMGAHGALVADADGVSHAHVPEITEINATGSGDLLLAGMAVGIERGQRPREAIVLGAACGTAGATHLPPELPPDFQPADWMSRISLEIVAQSP